MEEYKPLIWIWIGIAAIFSLWSIVRGWIRKAYLEGMQEAATRMIIGVSGHYEKRNEPIPERVAAAVDRTKKALDKKDLKVAAREYGFGCGFLGEEMGLACYHRGFEEGRQWTGPRGDDIRLDLTGAEVVNIAFLAHLGFEQMLFTKELQFNDEADAEKASAAIRKVERVRPAGTFDESDPYAQATNRMQMIWERYRPLPEETQA